ncbi:WD repeat domain phosphoinositide-interacting protein 2-like isoform X2 [Anneissia japonica]|uniref:WD repeat domain phosphoinositide-interacting protein 2-like isoform X2 n=1 Tax=Anneissia japonica TaxID=1529436 RepID=UPI0014259B45|nr:WD repeat domain phosphoinositide-interacting protein 2-like isoform X2 [Anneissia japonica]
MNLASLGRRQPDSPLLFATFNQDCTSLAVGTETGYRLFSLNSVDKLEPIYENDNEDICIVERLFSSSLVAIVSLSSPRKLKVCHFKKGTEICNYSYSNTILAVKLNRMRLIVALEESLYIHNIRDMKVLHTIRETPPNPQGLCALSISNDNCYLAYPGSSHIGEVQIFDTVNLQAVNMIPAHDSCLAALAFDSTGSKLATASEKGTVIRVFTIPEGQKIFEFRRGVKRCVSISSLAFNTESTFLCVSSNTETVHIFKLETTKESKPQEEPSTWMGYLGKALMNSATYLPSQVTEVFSQGRAFATVKLPFSGIRNVCALVTISKPRVLIAAADGYLYIYNLDPTDGGDCTLLKQHRLDGAENTEAPADGAEGESNPGGEEWAERPSLTRGTFAAAAASNVHTQSSPHTTKATDYAQATEKSTRPKTDELLSEAVEEGIQREGTLPLHDENEFPPMTHYTDS